MSSVSCRSLTRFVLASTVCAMLVGLVAKADGPVIVSTPSVKILGPISSAHIGGTVTGGDYVEGFTPRALAVGDFNSDGISDIAVGAPDIDTVYVVFGRTTLPAQIDLAASADAVVKGPSGTHFGYSLATGDLNGDGFVDLVIGAPDAVVPSGDTDGAVFVVSGQSLKGNIDVTTVSPSLTVFGRTPAGRLGSGLAVGDLGGPTHADLVIGAPGSAKEDPFPGEVFLLFGGPFAGVMVDLSVKPADFTVLGTANEHLGQSLATGDLDNDGFGDLFIGAPHADRPGRGDAGVPPAVGSGVVYGFFGPVARGAIAQSTSASFSFYGYADGERCGVVIAAADVTGDGIADLIVGVGGPSGDVGGFWRDPLTPGYQIDAGSVIYVFAGKTGLERRRYDDRLGEWSTAFIAGGIRGFVMSTGKDNVPPNFSSASDILLGEEEGTQGGCGLLLGGSTLTAFRVRPSPPWEPDNLIDSASYEEPPVFGSHAGLGFEVVAADVNGDHAGDMISSAPFEDVSIGGTLRSQAGAVDIWFGTPPTAPPGPSVSSIVPASGPSAGGTPVKVFGDNFQSGASVMIGGGPATNVLIGSQTVIAATTPAHASGSADVVVTNPDGQSATLAGAFTYTGPPPPVISSVLAQGKNLVVTGQGFDATAVIQLNGSNERTIDTSATELVGKKVVKLIVHGQTVTVTVQNGGGAVSQGFQFTRP